VTKILFYFFLHFYFIYFEKKTNNGNGYLNTSDVGVARFCGYGQSSKSSSVASRSKLLPPLPVNRLQPRPIGSFELGLDLIFQFVTLLFYPDILSVQKWGVTQIQTHDALFQYQKFCILGFLTKVRASRKRYKKTPYWIWAPSLILEKKIFYKS
jgi:hypothetical protein